MKTFYPWLAKTGCVAVVAAQCLGLAAERARAAAWVATSGGVIGLWHADGNGNDAAGTNHASLFGGVTFAQGVVGLGFKCDGTDGRIVVPDAPVLNFAAKQDFSIEAWIKPDAAPGNFQGIMSVVSKRVAPDTIRALGYELYLRDGKLGFQLSDHIAPYGWRNFESAGPDLRDGKFHHVAVTVNRRSETGGTLYVDGEALLTFDPTASPGDLSNTGPLRIGNHPQPGLPCFFNGVIDEVSIYNRALPAAEIKSASLLQNDNQVSLSAEAEMAGPQVRSLTRQTGGVQRLEFTGPGAAYSVQGSTDLVNWQTIAPATRQADGSFVFDDPDASRFPARFYRIVAP